MSKTLLLMGPTIMIFIGLTLIGNVPLTFALFYGWLLLIPVYSSWKKQNHSQWKFSITSRSLMLGMGSGTLVLVIIFAAVSYFFSFLIDLELIRLLLKKWNFDGKMIWVLIAVLLVLNPYLEENYWRNFIFEELKMSTSAGNAIIISSFFYSLYHLLSLIELFHWPFNVLAVIPIFLAGIIWGIFRYKSGSLAAPILSHVLADTGIILIYLVYIHTW
ncbi:CPBP family intramembrane metalloprotease [Rossellomorea vietnamensis]|uniref:CPBP family intramembrane metalloprotease n=1 Tax=Rossellomorea vietnamensis TaxID=218284 RepID=A0A5D4NTD1_9BACI|nr:CPBP family intramembrane glutamic endopeptidase [Rossellomorea vietnamensis]TYS17593.1 CPBP family intramembrane metalloprotease [Rossellomorea vietnamensis]